MPYPVLQVANRILTLARAAGKIVDPLKLQKLTYLAHGWNLAFTGQPLVEGGFSAWKYGPVNEQLYRHFKQYRADVIPGTAVQPVTELDEYSESLLREILRVYGDKRGVDLSSLTHEPDSAWSAIYSDTLFSSPTIPDYMIKAEFDKRKAEGRG